MTDGARWHRVRIYRAETAMTDLLLDAVRPVLDRVAPHVVTAYFRRGWLGGPHVELSLLAADDVIADVATPIVEDVVGRYLATHPGGPPLPRTRAEHELLAAYELVPDVVWPPLPTDTIHWPDVPTTDRSPSDGLIDDHYAATTPLTWEMLESVRTGRSQLSVAFDLMAAVAHAYCRNPREPGIASGFVSFRSHADVFVASCREPDAVRERLRAAYLRRRESLTERLSQVVDTVTGTSTAVPFVRGWVAAVRPVAERARTMIAAGIPLLPVGAVDRLDEHPLGRGLARSPLHRRILGNDALMAMLSTEPWFLEYRLQLNLLYLHLTRLGVTPVERYQLCHLVASATEDAYGISADDIIGEFVAAHPNRRADHARAGAGGELP